METNLKIVGFANQSFNGQPITNKGININYDGRDADINAYDDGKMYYMHLDNDDIKNLLNMPASQTTLEERLLTDFAPARYRTPTPYPRIQYVIAPPRRKKTRRHKPKTPRIIYVKRKTKTKTKKRTPPIDRTVY